ncbi:MAG: hypothetical protein ACRCSB_03580 [Bacteroidales bacterium]
MKTDFASAICHHISCFAELRSIPSKIYNTPFQIIEVPEKKLAFHLIDLSTYYTFEGRDGGALFFSALTAQFSQQDIHLIHLWEDIWHCKKAQVEARIATLLGDFTRYHARQTSVCTLNRSQALRFLEAHHFQVPLDGLYKYGLFLKDELLAVALFSRGCRMKQKGENYRSHELLRFANATGVVVAGGLSKLLAHFVREKMPNDIMTYVDCDWGNGKSYKLLGFERVECMPSKMFFLDKTSMMRHYCLPSEGDSENFVPIYNAGNYKFIYQP